MEYREKDPQMLTESEIRKYRKSAAHTEVHKTLDSTNNRAKELAMCGAESGTLVLADAQTQGRGRFGRKFHSPEGTGLYMSLLLRPKMPAEQAVRVTILAAVAAAQAVEALAGGHAEIKWVNDLYMGGKKVCGILTEAGMDFERGALEYCIVGLGMNVSAWEYPEEIARIATSVEEQTGKCVSRNRLAAEIVNRIEEGLGDIQSPKLTEEYRRRSCVLGRHVTVYRGNDVFDALAEEIADDGALLVRTSDGAAIALHSGEVSLKIRP